MGLFGEFCPHFQFLVGGSCFCLFTHFLHIWCIGFILRVHFDSIRKLSGSGPAKILTVGFLLSFYINIV